MGCDYLRGKVSEKNTREESCYNNFGMNHEERTRQVDSKFTDFTDTRSHYIGQQKEREIRKNKNRKNLKTTTRIFNI